MVKGFLTHNDQKLIQTQMCNESKVSLAVVTRGAARSVTAALVWNAQQVQFTLHCTYMPCRPPDAAGDAS